VLEIRVHGVVVQPRREAPISSGTGESTIWNRMNTLGSVTCV
jgi:hypothetical protein